MTVFLFAKRKITLTFFTFRAFIILTLCVRTALSPSLMSILGFLSYFLEVHKSPPGRTSTGLSPLFVEEVLMSGVEIYFASFIPSTNWQTDGVVAETKGRHYHFHQRNHHQKIKTEQMPFKTNFNWFLHLQQTRI